MERWHCTGETFASDCGTKQLSESDFIEYLNKNKDDKLIFLSGEFGPQILSIYEKQTDH